MNTFITAVTVGIGIEAALVAAFIIGGMGPCSAPLLSAFVLTLHTPGVALVNWLHIPDAIGGRLRFGGRYVRPGVHAKETIALYELDAVRQPVGHRQVGVEPLTVRPIGGVPVDRRDVVVARLHPVRIQVRGQLVARRTEPDRAADEWVGGCDELPQRHPLAGS